ncbi:tetratricopeptide repeat domain-containing protein [Viridothelium virens]|uniref:Tetratricopeptide repeat domain-containing protein n=1 Tax=Viridothelium virens TaxID=1048519 RepID=A0A6A6H3W3_VIRVR|nr:tetratricopeptide repeat domain-containing protein [Viridothelium virens]
MAARELRELYGRSLDADVDFVLINGIGMSPVEDWAIFSQPWTETITNCGCRIKFLSFDYEAILDDKFSLEFFHKQGEILLNSLLRHYEIHGRPLAFMSYSFGAFVLKQALCIANAQSQKFDIILHSILGIIFLGGFQSASRTAKLSELSLSLLKYIPNSISKQACGRIAEETRLLRDISTLFQEIQLRVDILSIYETKDTNPRTVWKERIGLFGTPRKVKRFTDEEAVKINSPREQCFGLAGSHADLWRLEQDDGLPDQRLMEWMKFCFGKDNIDAVRKKATSEMLCKKSTSPTASLTSLSSHDAARLALAQEPRPLMRESTDGSKSNGATTGSSTMKSWELVPILDGFTIPRRSAQLPCFMMETLVPNKEFFGRESVLSQLDELLLPSEDATFSSERSKRKHVVLYGMGGLGKTSVAVEFAFSRKERFDAVFWIHADEPAKLEQDFSQIAVKLGLEDISEPRNPVVSRELAKGWLENPRRVINQQGDIVGQAEAHWLLIFDNADRPDALQDYWPVSSNGSVLVTSRDPLSKTTPSIAAESIDLKPFDIPEAAAFLRSITHYEREEALSIEIAKKLGGFPLAISQMAAMIRYQYLSFSDFLNQYEDERNRKQIHAYELGALRREARGNIATIWAIEQLEPQARTILELSAVLDPDCIPDRLFQENLTPANRLENYPRTGFEFSAARADLIKRSLINRNDEKKEFWIHRILQDCVLMKMTPETMERIFSTALELIVNAWGIASLDKRHVLTLSRSREALFPHALSLKNLYEKLYLEGSSNTSLLMAFLLNEAGWFQHERGNSQDIKSFLKLALEICVRNSHHDTSQLMADIHYGLAAVANETNDADACLHHTKSLLDMRLKVFEASGHSDIRLAIAHNEMAIAWVMNGQYKNAIQAFENSIKVYRAMENYSRAIDTNPRTNLGFTYWIMGQNSQAYEILEALLRDRELRFGKGDTESYRTGRVYHGLGNIRYDQGRFEESEEWHEKALSHYQVTLGKNHHKTADLCHRVAQHWIRRDELEAARTLVDQALKVWRLRESVYTPEIARTTFLKAKIMMKQGDEFTATNLFKDAKSLRSRISGASEKADADLRESDFDTLVTFFSR